MSSEPATQTPPNSSAALANASTPSPTAVLELIAAAHLISSANHVYFLLAAAAFAAACFLLYAFVRTYRAQRESVARLARLLWTFCGLQLLLVFFSLYNVAHRPHSLRTSALGCAALSFAVNVASLCGLLVLALMAYALALDPPSNSLTKRPGVCAALVVLTSAVVSLLLAGIRGPREGLQLTTDCFVDPIHAGVPYAVAKLCLAFLIPFVLQLALVIYGCVRKSKSNRRFLCRADEGPAFLAASATLLFCHLLYVTALARGARLQAAAAAGELSPRQRALVSVAELVFFAGSGFSLVLVPLTHRPSRERLCGLFRRVADCCPRAAHAQTNRNIVTPHVENADTLQDIES
ncbi:uncharacterized protein LOC144038114 [Vanacampus margaritifer]